MALRRAKMHAVAFFYSIFTPRTPVPVDTDALPQDAEDRICHICKEPYTTELPVKFTRCGHVFGQDCLTEWSKHRGRHPTCLFCDTYYETWIDRLMIELRAGLVLASLEWKMVLTTILSSVMLLSVYQQRPQHVGLAVHMCTAVSSLLILQGLKRRRLSAWVSCYSGGPNSFCYHC